ncbi:hypothetical protein [Halobaculum marinum]|uniref:Uncharacterized protein n=1 Tax=Halobaculum marinum TaxID=3031996 RepID=A0ABD5WVJ6_9EURY|nr:hypothetical protein [Halobaculum sp. DT55]
MADDKQGRDKQAHDSEKRRRAREIAIELERGDEPEPPVEQSDVEALVADLASVAFPATGADIVAAVGDREIGGVEETYTVEELIPESDHETFDSPTAVGVHVRRPTVASAMKRIVEAVDTLPNARLDGSQREGYERTLRELAAIDAVDEDEGIPVVTDWIVEQIHEKRALPGSRSVRREAASFCRANGYEVRNDEWLGV